jgi:hypothetical protein
VRWAKKGGMEEKGTERLEDGRVGGKDLESRIARLESFTILNLLSSKGR